MKKVLFLSAVFMLCASLSFGAAFSPTLLKFEAPQSVKYDFDGKNLTIPVTVTGTNALALFLVFTKDKANTISKVKNGYLGWHYVNKIDTCLYVSPGINMSKGTNNIIWAGKDENGAVVPAGEYTYYIWGYDNVTARQLAIYAITFGSNQYYEFQYKDQDGKALGQPIMRGVTQKWVMGTDPMDSLLVEKCSIPTPTGWSQIGYGPSVLDPKDFSMFYISCANKESVIQGITKYQWVPNGKAVQQTGWGDKGYVTYSATLDAEPGVVSDGTYLYSGDSNHHAITAMASMYAFDFDGSIIKQIDLTEWWSNPNDMAAGGQMNGGPTIYHEKNGYIFLGCHCSCLRQMVSPLADAEDFVVWTNSNGDYTFDHNYDKDAKNKWVCFDFNVGPYTYNTYSDANLFSIAPSYDLGAVSFGLAAPDGSGLSYFAFSGETASQKYGNTICDGNTAYDGIYTTINTADVKTAISKSCWFVGHDSIKGTIGSQIGVKESAPAAFSVAQNTPNPFNPSTTISFTLAKPGKTTVEVFNAAGQKVGTVLNANLSAGSHSVNWNAADHSAGVYFYTVKNGEFTKTMKMTLLK